MLSKNKLQTIINEQLLHKSLIQIEFLDNTQTHAIETVVAQIQKVTICDGDILVRVVAIDRDYQSMTVSLSKARITPIGNNGFPNTDRTWSFKTYGQQPITQETINKAANLDWDVAASDILN